MNRRARMWLLSFCAVQPTLCALLLLGNRLGFRPAACSALAALLQAALGVCAVAFARKTREKGRAEAALRALCLLFAMAHALVACVLGSRMYAFGALTGVACALALLGRGGAWRTALRIAAVPPLALALVLLVGRLAFSPFVATAVVQRAEAPDGRYSAELIDIDEGALGGRTVVEVTSRLSAVGLPDVALWTRRVHSSDWRGEEELRGWDFRWIDGETLSVNGEAVRAFP